VNCIVAGYPSPLRVAQSNLASFVLSTQDGGQAWTSGLLPSGFAFLQVNTDISCADASNCMAIGQVSIPNPDQCVGDSQTPPPGYLACNSSPTTLVSGVVTTADGGATWLSQPLPAALPLPQISAVSCTGAGTCWLAGTVAIPQNNNSGGINGGSAIVLSTSDTGTSWAQTLFSVPSGGSSSVNQGIYQAIQELTCPMSNSCIGLGAADTNSSTTPVYNFTGP
jgi:hypothetical protein